MTAIARSSPLDGLDIRHDSTVRVVGGAAGTSVGVLLDEVEIATYDEQDRPGADCLAADIEKAIRHAQPGATS